MNDADDEIEGRSYEGDRDLDGSPVIVLLIDMESDNEALADFGSSE